jgi:hypothetical protein
MAATLKTRKPIDALTVEDLDAFPIWEFAADEEGEDEDQDETWVRPVNSKVVPQGEYSLSVSATFTTTSGHPLHGFIVLSTDEGIEINGGVVLFKEQYLPVSSPDFWGASAERAELAAALELPQEEVFPLSFSLSVPVEGQPQSIEGAFTA